MKKLMIPLLSLIILSAGCGGNVKQNTEQNNSAMDTLQQKHQEENAGEKAEAAGNIILNNGAKWQANAETTAGINKMLALVTGYLNNENSDIKALGQNLEKEFTDILQKCTMTGEAHNQLHNFLLPLKDKIEQLKEHQKTETVSEIQTYLNTYNTYFQ
ncbi:MAG: hypothetical protein Q8M15_11635 [Bacteroidota bacterium]|nr:hypothetical protein [Bacteroidota bacterium]